VLEPDTEEAAVALGGSVIMEEEAHARSKSIFI
jgi:hypothetical protein